MLRGGDPMPESTECGFVLPLLFITPLPELTALVVRRAPPLWPLLLPPPAAAAATVTATCRSVDVGTEKVLEFDNDGDWKVDRTAGDDGEAVGNEDEALADAEKEVVIVPDGEIALEFEGRVDDNDDNDDEEGAEEDEEEKVVTAAGASLAYFAETGTAAAILED